MFIKLIENMVNRKTVCIIYNTEFSYNNSKGNSRMLIDDDIYPEGEMRIASFRMGNEKIVLWMGVLNKAQGFDSMERIRNDMLRSYDDIRFVIIGFPTSASMIKKFEAFKDRVIFTGRVPYESIPSLLIDADICISTKSQNTEGSSKLHLYRRFCRNTLALKSNAADELLSKEQICTDEKQIIDRIRELVRV